MNTTSHPTPFGRRSKLALGFAAATSLALLLGGAAGLAGCESDEAIGHTKTTEKRTVETPNQKTTVTETHEKDTKYVPK